MNNFYHLYMIKKKTQCVPNETTVKAWLHLEKCHMMKITTKKALDIIIRRRK